MRDRLDELGDAEVVVVTFTRARNLPGYRRRFADPLTVVADEERAVYRTLGLGRGPWWRVYGGATLRRYARLLRRGRRLERPTEDTLQLGGDAVVDPDGRLAWVFRGSGPDDRPTVDEVVDAVTRSRSG